MAVPITAKYIEETTQPHELMSQARRVGFDLVRDANDPIQHNKIHSESIASYVSSSLMRFDKEGNNLIDTIDIDEIDTEQIGEPRQTKQKESLVERAKRVIEGIEGQVHLQLSRQYIKGHKKDIEKLTEQENQRDIAFISGELRRFLGIKRGQEFKNVLEHFEPYLLDEDWSDKTTIDELYKQQEVFYSLVRSRVQRLPNLRLYISKKDRRGNNKYYQRVIYTYVIILKNNELFGVLHISYTVSEIKESTYNKKEDRIFPRREEGLCKLKNILDRELDSSERDKRYLLEVEKINKEIENQLYKNDERAIVHNFLREIRPLTQNSSGGTLRELIRKVNKFDEKPFIKPNGKTVEFCACIVMANPGQTIAALSPGLVRFWWPEGINNEINITNLDFYHQTYHICAIKDPDLYRNIAEQQRYTILAHKGKSPNFTTLFIENKGKFYKLYRSIGYIDLSGMYTLFIMQIEEIERFEFREGTHPAAKKEKDSVSGTFLSFEHSSIVYRAVFELMDVIAPERLEEAVERKSLEEAKYIRDAVRQVLARTMRGTIFFEFSEDLRSIIQEKTILNNGAETFLGNSAKNATTSTVLELLRESFEKDKIFAAFALQYNENQSLLMPFLGTRRLPDIYLERINKRINNGFFINIIYCFVVYIDEILLGTIYGYHEEQFEDEKSFGKRLHGLTFLRHTIRETHLAGNSYMTNLPQQAREIWEQLSFQEQKSLSGEFLVDVITKSNKSAVSTVQEIISTKAEEELNVSPSIAENTPNKNWLEKLTYNQGDQSWLGNSQIKDITLQEFMDEVRNVKNKTENHKFVSAFGVVEELRHFVEGEVKRVNPEIPKESTVGVLIPKKSHTLTRNVRGFPKGEEREYASVYFQYRDKEGEKAPHRIKVEYPQQQIFYQR